MSTKTWIIFAGVVVLLLGGLIYFSSKDKLDVSNIDITAQQAASDQNGNIADHVFGKVDSKVVLIEYGDFQCPGCGGAHPRIKEIAETYKEQLNFTFRNFPITSIHPNAKVAAAAVEAAGLQGKYWEMHNLVFESQDAWKNATTSERTGIFEGYAVQVGANLDTFKKDLATSNVNKKIAFDQALGKKATVDSTPTFFLNGVKLDQAVWGDSTKLKAAIDAELKKVGVEPPVSTTTSTTE